MTKLRSVLVFSGVILLAAPVNAAEFPPASDSVEPAIPTPNTPAAAPAPDAIVEHIEDYAPTECTGQISYTNDTTEIANRLTSLTQNFSQTVESILASTSTVDCAAVTGTLTDTTQNINYLHDTKGVYKVLTSAEPTESNTEEYIYTFDILGVRYIPYTAETTLDTANSNMLRAIGGTCTIDDLNYPYEADCTFAVTDETNSMLSIGKLHYYF